jgi:hypothetical protein
MHWVPGLLFSVVERPWGETGHLRQSVLKLWINGTIPPASHIFHSMDRDNFYLICSRGRSKACGCVFFCSTRVFVCDLNVLLSYDRVLFALADTSMWTRFRQFMLTDLVIWNHLPGCKYCSFTDCFITVIHRIFKKMSVSLKRCKKKWSDTVLLWLKCPCTIFVLISNCCLNESQNV